MITKKYKQERRVFDRLRSDCSVEAKREYELAISTLLERYNTTIYENRFVVGGAVEFFTYALLCSVGISCNSYGEQAIGGDILLPDNKLISVKGSFTGGATNIKLMNKMGEGDRTWTTATLFVIADVGIIFGAPDMISDEYVKYVGDGTELTKKGLNFLIDDSNNVLEMEIMRKPPTEVAGRGVKVSTTVAKQILAEMDSGILSNSY